jgi:hypothetical protein
MFTAMRRPVAVSVPKPRRQGRAPRALSPRVTRWGTDGRVPRRAINAERAIEVEFEAPELLDQSVEKLVHNPGRVRHSQAPRGQTLFRPRTWMISAASVSGSTGFVRTRAKGAPLKS